MIAVSRNAWIGIGLLSALPWAAVAQTSPLVGDAMIIPGNATNAGSLATVNVGGITGTQALLQFDLSTLPPGTLSSNVLLATLRLYVNKVASPGAINVYTATSAWTESSVNGLNGPGPGSLVAGPISISTANAYLSIPVTAQVQAWLTGAPNNGFFLQSAGGSTNVMFDSKENTATSHPAVL